MSEYHISNINYNDKRTLKQLDALLEKEGITRDKSIDYTAGLFDEDYNLVASGSCFENTLRCLAVDSSHQGEGLMNQLISHLIDFQFQRGNVHLFLYTKCDKAAIFADLGFREIARVDGKLVFMENKTSGFCSYLDNLKKESGDLSSPSAAIIMNANPFTKGHQYLVERASSSCEKLHLFVVSEDVSLFPFDVRFLLVKNGTSHIKNIIYHQTGSYMISNATFPSYFLKDSDTVIHSHARLDTEIFRHIADALNINHRFVGEEPFSQVTGIYNSVMKETLENAGITCSIIPRISSGNVPISASNVRSLIKENRLDDLKELLPATTYSYIISPAAQPVIQKIKAAENVIHH